MNVVVRNAVGRLIKGQVKELEEYIDLLDAAIKEEAKTLSKRIDSAVAGVPEDEQGYYVGDWFAEEIGAVTESLPRLLWYGAFISIYNYFEHEMLSVARRDLRMHKGVFPPNLNKKQQELKYVPDTAALSPVN